MDNHEVYHIDPTESPILWAMRQPPMSDEQRAAWRKERIESDRTWYARQMTVGELMVRLQGMPPEAKICIEDDYDYRGVSENGVEEYESNGEKIGPLVAL